MKFTLRQLELFVALRRFSTMSAAAESLHISESALSHAISKLEGAMGAQLCVRRKAQGLQLTPTGHFVADRATALLGQVDELMSGIAALQGEVVGSIRVGCYASLASTVLPRVMEGLPAEHPGLGIEVSVGSREKVIGELKEGFVDFAFLYDEDLPSELAKIEIYEAEAVVVLPEAHPFAHHESVTIESLASEPLVLLDTAPSASVTLKMFSDRSVVPNIAASVPQIDLFRALIGRGVGYGIHMSRPWSSEITTDGHRVVFKKFNPSMNPTRVVGAWPADAELSARARVALEYARAAFEASDPELSTPHNRTGG